MVPLLALPPHTHGTKSSREIHVSTCNGVLVVISSLYEIWQLDACYYVKWNATLLTTGKLLNENCAVKVLRSGNEVEIQSGKKAIKSTNEKRNRREKKLFLTVLKDT